MEPLLTQHQLKVFISLVVQAVFAVIILVLITVIGWRVMMLYYHAPILVFASMLVITTFLVSAFLYEVELVLMMGHLHRYEIEPYG